MKRALLLPAALLALAIVPSSATAASCGTISGAVALYEVRAAGVGCSTARSVARTWRAKLLRGRCADGRFLCQARGFTCRAKPPAQVHYRVTCRRDGQAVRWDINAD